MGRPAYFALRAHARWRLPALSLLAVAVCLATAARSASGAINVNVSGAWNTVYHCQAGSCAGGSYPDVLKLMQATGSASVSGTDQLGGMLTGSLSTNASNQIVLTLKETDSSYTANFNVTLTVNGKAEAWTGTVTDSNGTSGTDTGTLEALALGQSGEAAAVSGSVSVEAPGSTSFTPLTSSTVIPMGSTINATSGTVELTLAKPGKGTETGEFYDGEFMINESHAGLAKETLEGGSFASCAPSGSARIASAGSGAKGAPVRQLWGHAHGSFETSGRGGAATVLGTIWLTQDYCNGTLFKAVKDAITVTEFAHPGRKHHVAQGHSIFVPLSGA